MQKMMSKLLSALFLLCLFSVSLQISNVFAATFSYCGPSGGVGGNHFSDLQASGQHSSDNRKLVEIRIRSGAFIDGIQTVYENRIGQRNESSWHGGSGGKLSVFKLAPDEYVIRINGKYGRFVDHIEIITSKGRHKGWGATGGAKHFVYNAPPGSHVHGFGGHAGKFIDSIGVIFKSP